MIILNPLKNPLEGRVTVLRVYRSVSLELNPDIGKWRNLCEKIASVYKSVGGEPLKKVFQKSVFEDCNYGRNAVVYPSEFIPVMVNIIKDHIKE